MNAMRSRPLWAVHSYHRTLQYSDHTRADERNDTDSLTAVAVTVEYDADQVREMHGLMVVYC